MLLILLTKCVSIIVLGAFAPASAFNQIANLHHKTIVPSVRFVKSILRSPAQKGRAALAMTTSTDLLVKGPWTVVPQDAPPKVKDIFRYLESNPVGLEGIPMAYETPADIALDRADSHFAVTLCGLLELACGGLDECHDRITPLSWESYTLFGGEPIENSPARCDATYIHHLVHLREGHHPGEFGTGYNNSAYWTSVLGSHPLFEEVCKAAMALAEGNEALKRRLAKDHAAGWNPRAFISLCASSARGGGGSSSDADMAEAAAAAELCRGIMNAQLRLLFDSLWARLRSA